jgi:hypothetical protein
MPTMINVVNKLWWSLGTSRSAEAGVGTAVDTPLSLKVREHKEQRQVHNIEEIDQQRKRNAADRGTWAAP